MAAAGGQTLGRSSFSRATSNPATSSSGATGVKLGPNGVAFLSSGIPDLDTLSFRDFGWRIPSRLSCNDHGRCRCTAPPSASSLFHGTGCHAQAALLFAGPIKEPRLFLGTLPAPVSSSKENGRHRAMGVIATSDGRANDEGLRIAWQYKKYFGDEKTSHAEHKGNKQEFSNDFDLRKPLERHLLNGQNIECDWDMVSFIRSLMTMVRSSNSVAVIAFPNEDKDLAKLLTGYQDMVGFLHVHKVAQTNSQVPVIVEASTLFLKLRKRRSLVLERLNQAPVDGSSGPSSAASGSCSSPQGSQLDF
ncbi:hypothetical protein BAE44_0001805 [Dichanthelium oligosanthes]|uniref:Elongator complex protein 4 n=1 Tax=Dichanthelium oligosanthes TaxID=888268 RepID=A0A1E5WIE9_9POAL|nr:hypothetical protein BAE44_0001805 [Dichanthelium oligosanthes]